MSDLLLIYPSLEVQRDRENYKFGWAANGQGYMPLFAVFLASYLKEHGYTTTVLDLDIYSSSKENELLSEILPKVRFAGISAMTAQVPHALEITKRIKKIAPQVKTIWGGVHATLMPEITISHPDIDYAISGEGEEPLLRLLQGSDHARIHEEGKEIDTVGCAPFLHPDEMPDPDYSFIEVDRYFEMQGDYRNLDFQASRGCSSKCSFCINTIVENKWRGIGPERAAENMFDLKEKYQMKHTFFRDEHFFSRKNWVKTFLASVADLGITMEANMRVDVLAAADDDYLKLIRDSGFLRLRMGAESASNRMLKLLNKHITRDQIVRARDRSLEFDMVPMMSFMVYMPDELPDETESTYKFAEEHRDAGALVIGPQRFRPYPGSLEYNKLVERNQLQIPQTMDEWAECELFSTVL